jgi:replicative DNA helicase
MTDMPPRSRGATAQEEDELRVLVEQASDEDELRVLVEQAWELRNSPYYLDACAAVEDWHDRRHLRRFDRRQEGNARMILLLRETDPDRVIRKRDPA